MSTHQVYNDLNDANAMLDTVMSEEDVAFAGNAIDRAIKAIDALTALRRNVDISTIRPTYRVTAKWDELVREADEALSATGETSDEELP